MAPRHYTLDNLKYLMARLRDPQTGCPWDVEQTYRTIAPSTIEEAYEVVDAIERDNLEHLQEELGDLLFQVVFYCQIALEEERFTLDDVISALVSKLVRRHPHVFPDNTLESQASVSRTPEQEAEIKARWEALKREERQAKGQAGLLDDIPINLSALTRAAKMQKRAATVGFDWPSMEGVIDKIEEELGEVKQALNARDSAAIREEFGDLLFAVVNGCRHQKVEPEGALRGTNYKFEQRFSYIEKALAERGLSAEEAPLELMDALWDEAKTRQR